MLAWPLLLMIPGLAALNRGAGVGDWFRGIGRNIYAVIPLTGLLGYLLTADVLYALALAMSMATYRLPGWYGLLDMGRNNPGYLHAKWSNTSKDFALMSLRQMLFFPIHVALFWGQPWHCLLAIAATGLAGGLGYLAGHLLWAKGKTEQPNTWAEVLAGAFIGGVVAVSTIIAT